VGVFPFICGRNTRFTKNKKTKKNPKQQLIHARKKEEEETVTFL
jgi:hypothetical protein